MAVLVTRPREQAERTGARLRALGYEPLIAPVLHVASTDDPPPEGAFHALVVTSANAIPSLARLAGRARSLPIFAVGTRTADLLREAGWADVHIGEGNAESLAVTMARLLPSRASLLHVTGRDRKAEPEESLLAAGYRVASWAAYAAIPVPRLPEGAAKALRGGEIQAALHYSRRSAATLKRLAEAAGLLSPLLRLSHVCLSADIADAWTDARRIAVADHPDEDALLTALKALDRTPVPP
jgi:uroporphyrinogen-III synthase